MNPIIQRLKIISKICVIFFTLFSYVHIRAQITYEAAFPAVKFEYAVELQNANDGTNRMFVLEQKGLVKVFTLDGNVNASDVGTFLDITDRVSFSDGQEIGLLGLAFHPNYSTNGYFYVYYTTSSPLPNISTRAVLSRFTVSSSDMNIANKSSELILFQFDKNQNNSNHNGGKIAFGPDEYLYISFGDGGGANDPEGNGQDINSIFGSICRIDVDLDGNNPVETNPVLPNGNYEIPMDNPFVGVSGLDEIYAYGLRNTWKFSFDDITGRFWGADVGQGEFEEINIIEKGGNYGWSRYEALAVANSDVVITEKTIFPVFFYNHTLGVSITGGYVYRGSGITSSNPDIQSKYIFGDYVTGRVWALEYNQSTGASSSTLLFKTNGQTISSFGKDEAGELYFSDYGVNSEIYRLVDGTTPLQGTVVNGIGEWNSLDQGVMNGVVYAIASYNNGNIYHGGSFSKVGTINANNIAVWNANSGWQSMGNGSNGTINALAVDSNGNVYAGGSFTEIGGIDANNIAIWNGVQWSALSSGIDGPVAALQVDATNNLFVGGIFEEVNGVSARNIASWNGSQWSVLTDTNTMQSGANNEVRSLSIDESGMLYVGGNFNEAGGVTANRIATWNGSNWGTLGSGTSGFVQAIITTSTDIYIGGNFTIAGGNTVNRIAKWNKASSSWSALGNGVNNIVYALLNDGDFIYAGGAFDIAFTETEGVIVDNIARWSTADHWEALGSSTQVGVDIIINALQFSSNSVEKIYAGGNFTRAGAIIANNTALWLSDNLLDISEFNNDNTINVYPNPSTGILKLSQDKEWMITTILGEIISKGQGTNIDISDYTAGIYILKVKNGKTFKIIKQ